MSDAGDSPKHHPRLSLPSLPGFRLTSGSFEIPQTKVKVNLRPELVGELLVLLAEAVESGVDADWFRPGFENAASKVVETATGREYLEAFIDLAVLAERHNLISATELDDVRTWGEEAQMPEPTPPCPVCRAAGALGPGPHLPAGLAGPAGPRSKEEVASPEIDRASHLR